MISSDNIEAEPNPNEKSYKNKSIGLISNSEEIPSDINEEKGKKDKKEYKNDIQGKNNIEEKEEIEYNDDNYFEESNEKININDSLKLYENQIDSKNSNINLLGSEEIFINQKLEIEKMKKKNELFYIKKESLTNSQANTKNNFNNNIIYTNKSNEIMNTNILKSTEINEKIKNLYELNNEIIEDLQTFSLNDNKNFEYIIINDENIDENYKDNSKVVELDNNMWKPLNEEFPFSYGEDALNNSYNFIEINRLAIRFKQEIDYDEKGVELNMHFNLEEQSELWIFSRCYVNKSINESFYFDEKSENIDINDNFNKYTSLIKIIRDANYKGCYITLGTFYHETNENNKLYYKTFLKRQLIDYSNDNIKSKNTKEDKFEFNVIINDLGEETINTKIYLNNKIKYDEINGNFFLPINKKAKILICGSGKSVQLKNLVVKTFNKRKIGLKTSTQFETENDTMKNCECCSIL